MQTYTVIRAHWGDKEYKVGDTRTARESDVAHLIGRCLEVQAEDPVEAEKMAAPVKDKAAPKFKNKAAK